MFRLTSAMWSVVSPRPLGGVMQTAYRCVSLKMGGIQLKHVKWHQDEDGVRRITLTNAKRRNVLSDEAMRDIIAAFVCEKCDNQHLRAYVIDAEGPVFSAGHYVKELRSEDGIDHHRQVFQTCRLLMNAIRNSPVPVIAKVNGAAAAAGCQLVATCDIVVASEKSKFSTPGGNLGLFCHTPGVALVRNVPMKLAALMLYTGRPIDAETALRAGLVSCVVPEEELDAKTEEILQDIVSKSKPVIKMGRDFLRINEESPTMHSAMKQGSEVMVQNLRLRDCQEGIDAFIEKRKPEYTHEDYTVH